MNLGSCSAAETRVHALFHPGRENWNGRAAEICFHLSAAPLLSTSRAFYFPWEMERGAEKHMMGDCWTSGVASGWNVDGTVVCVTIR